MSSQKQCSSCHCWKALDEFHRRSASPDKRQSRCKTCREAWRVSNRERIATYMAPYMRDWRVRQKRKLIASVLTSVKRTVQMMDEAQSGGGR